MSGSSAIILCYHKVGPESEEGRSLNIEPSRLESHIRHFQRRGYRFVLGSNFSGEWPSKSICLTFDDAYVSALSYGRDVMLRLGVRGTYYVVSGCIGGTSSWDGEKSRPLADESTLLEAQSQGFELGNHTANHPHLAEMTSGVTQEIDACKRWLASRGIKGESFCYPYGSVNDAVVSDVRSSEYTVGMALGKRAAEPGDDLLRLPRIVVAFSNSLPMLLYKVHLRKHLLR